MSAEQSLISGDRYLGGLLVFLLQAVRKYLLLVILLPLVVMASAFFIARHLAPVYGVQAGIRIGRVDGAESLSPQAAASRINSLAFKQRVLQSMNIPSGDGQLGRLVSAGLAARQETSDVVAVGARGSTTQQVRQVLDITVQLLNEEQQRVGGPLLADIKEQLATSDANIASLLQARESLTTLTKSLEVPTGDAAAASFRAVWLLDLVSRSELRLDAARAERRALASRLGSWRTYPSALVDGAFVTPVNVAPRAMAIAVVAGMLTLLICILFVLMRQPKNTGPRW
jgi:hypothetical protein